MKVRSTVARPRLLRTLGVGSVCYGVMLVAAPRQVVSAVSRSSTNDGPAAHPPVVIVRVLGVRQIGQGAVLLFRPSTLPTLAGVAVDAVHALTMVAAGIRWPGYRAVAGASAAVAVASSVVGTHSLRARGARLSSRVFTST